MPTRSTFLLAAVLAGFHAVPARAEDNRLLPFWGQPFPSGYAWPEAVSAMPIPRCRTRLAGYGRDLPLRTRCTAVLHVRD